MFYIIEQLKGTPKANKGLLFGNDNIYDYYVVGCATPKVLDYYGKESNKWSEYNQRYRPEDFIKQIQKISKREEFRFVNRSF